MQIPPSAGDSDMIREAYKLAITELVLIFPDRDLTPDVQDAVVAAIMDLARAGQVDRSRLATYAVSRAKLQVAR